MLYIHLHTCSYATLTLQTTNHWCSDSCHSLSIASATRCSHSVCTTAGDRNKRWRGNIEKSSALCKYALTKLGQERAYWDHLDSSRNRSREWDCYLTWMNFKQRESSSCFLGFLIIYYVVTTCYTTYVTGTEKRTACTNKLLTLFVSLDVVLCCTILSFS